MSAGRILICLHDFSRGGTERIAIGLGAAWADAGREVTILCGADFCRAGNWAAAWHSVWRN